MLAQTPGRRPNNPQQRLRNALKQGKADTMAMLAEVNERAKQPNAVIKRHWSVFEPLTEEIVSKLLKQKFTFNQIRSAIQANKQLNQTQRNKYLKLVDKVDANITRELNEIEIDLSESPNNQQQQRNKFVTSIKNQHAALNAFANKVNTEAAKLRANQLAQIKSLFNKINKATTLQNIIDLTRELKGFNTRNLRKNKNLRKRIDAVIRKRNKIAKELRQKARSTEWLNHYGKSLANSEVQHTPQNRPTIQRNLLQNTKRGISPKTKKPWENAMRAAHNWENINFKYIQKYSII